MKKKKKVANRGMKRLEEELATTRAQWLRFAVEVDEKLDAFDERAKSEADLRNEAESAVYRKLIVSLLHDRPGIEAFLDRLGDVAPYLQKPPREGQVIELPDVVELISQRLTAYHVERIRQGGGVGEDQIIKAFSDWLVDEFIASKPFVPSGAL